MVRIKRIITVMCECRKEILKREIKMKNGQISIGTASRNDSK